VDIKGFGSSLGRVWARGRCALSSSPALRTGVYLESLFKYLGLFEGTMERGIGGASKALEGSTPAWMMGDR